MTDGGALRDRVERLATAVDGARAEHAGEIVTWSVGGRPFGVLDRAAIELRLDPAIARAATRTPDTTPSERGPDWVRFEPRELDDHAVDRLEAWFAFAARHARG